MAVFKTKNVTTTPAINENTKLPSFCPIAGKKSPTSLENFSYLNNFPCKMDGFGPMGQQNGDFVLSSTSKPLLTFLGLNYHTSP